MISSCNVSYSRRNWPISAASLKSRRAQTLAQDKPVPGHRAYSRTRLELSPATGGPNRNPLIQDKKKGQ